MATGYYLLDNPPARSQYRRTRRAKPTGCIVVHTAESILDQTGPDSGAENVARFIQRRTTPGSYHRIGDLDSIVKLIPFSYEAWQDGTGSNAWAIGISLAMQAHTWPDLTTKHRNQLIDTMARMAVEAAQWLKTEHNIDVPAERISKAESNAGKPGFIAHGDRDPARRTDPGRHFPWTQFLRRYQQILEGTTMADPLIQRIQTAAQSVGYSAAVTGELVEQNALDVEHMAKGIRNLIDDNNRLDRDLEEARRITAGLRSDITQLGATIAELEQQLTQSEADQDLAAAVRALIKAEQQ